MDGTRTTNRTADEFRDHPTAAPAVPHDLLLGIGGAGMRALAEILLDAGHAVTGSDIQFRTSADIFTHRPAGSHTALRLCDWSAAATLCSATVGSALVGSAPSGVVTPIDRVVTSAAVPSHDPRLVAAAERGLPVVLLSQALAECFSDRQQLCVAGTHGKTTTTGLLWSILEAAGWNPSGYVGGQMVDHVRSGCFRHSGRGHLAVIESCEYRSSFLSLSPRMVVLTGIERDHFDCFPTAVEEDRAFAGLADRLPTDGCLIVNGDCPRALAIAKRRGARVLTFGLTSDSMWQAANLRPQGSGMRFELLEHGILRGQMTTPLPGIHNVRNILAAVAAASEVGVSIEEMIRTVAVFHGIRRRFEHRGTWNGMELLDDYAHHPGAITATLSAARAIYPGRRLVVVFEPHQMSRTEQLREAFRQALAMADECLILPVLPAREQANRAMCCRASGRLVREINLGGGRAFLLANLDQVIARLDHAGRPGDVVVTMGAGRTNQIHDEFNRRLQRDYVA